MRRTMTLGLLATWIVLSLIAGRSALSATASTSTRPPIAHTTTKLPWHWTNWQQTRTINHGELAWLNSSVALCVKKAESGGDYRVGGMEPFGGAWQFAVSTWESLGLSGLPNRASAAVQDAAAYRLWLRDGWSQWQTAPGCGG